MYIGAKEVCNISILVVLALKNDYVFVILRYLQIKYIDFSSEVSSEVCSVI